MTTLEDIEYLLQLRKEIAKLNTAEVELRTRIAEGLLGEKTEGQVTGNIAGYKITAKAVMNYTVDKDGYALYEGQLTDEERKCFKLRPELQLAPFKKLPEGALAKLFVSSSKGRPQLTVVAEI